MAVPSPSRFTLSTAVVLTALPFLWILTKIPHNGILPVLANTLGFIGAVFLWWQCALGIRQITHLLVKDRQQLVRWHIALGTYGTLAILAHPVLEMIAYGAKLTFLYQPSFASPTASLVTLGRFAVFGLILLWISSVAIKKLLPYRPWRYTHFISYPVTLLVFLHAFYIGTYLETYPFLKAWWILLAVSFVGFSLWRIASPFIAGTRYTIATKESLPGGITTYALKPQGQKRMVAKVGQYAYLRMSLFGEAHPFTILRSHENGNLEFGIKTFGPFTKKLSAQPIGSLVTLEGPYGAFTQEGQNADAKVLIAGGIGITPFVQLIETFGNEKTFLVNCTRTAETAIWREVFKRQLGGRYVEILSQEEQVPEGSIRGFLTREILEQRIPKDIMASARFFICGPKPMMDLATTLLKELGVSANRIFFEKFTT